MGSGLTGFFILILPSSDFKALAKFLNLFQSVSSPARWRLYYLLVPKDLIKLITRTGPVLASRKIGKIALP